MYNILVFFSLLGCGGSSYLISRMECFVFRLFFRFFYSSLGFFPFTFFAVWVCVCVVCLASYRFQNESSFNSCLSMEMKLKFENYTFTIDWISFCYDRKQNTVDHKHKKKQWNRTHIEWRQKGYWKHTMGTWFVIFRRKKNPNIKRHRNLLRWFYGVRSLSDVWLICELHHKADDGTFIFHEPCREKMCIRAPKACRVADRSMFSFNLSLISY